MKTITRICAIHIKLLLCCATSVEGIFYYLSYYLHYLPVFKSVLSVDSGGYMLICYTRYS